MPDDYTYDTQTASVTRPRIGPRMRELQAIVSARPGISKRAALQAADLPECGLGHARPLNRAINAGLVIVDSACPWVRRPAHALFASERDRTIFYLRNELPRGQPTPQRADEIRAEVERLRAEQATTWVD